MKRLRWLVLGLDHYLKRGWVGYLLEEGTLLTVPMMVSSVQPSFAIFSFVFPPGAKENLALLGTKVCTRDAESLVPVVPSLTTSSVGGSGMPPVSPKLSPIQISAIYIHAF